MTLMETALFFLSFFLCVSIFRPTFLTFVSIVHVYIIHRLVGVFGLIDVDSTAVFVFKVYVNLYYSDWKTFDASK